jgi:hypothetical protein
MKKLNKNCSGNKYGNKKVVYDGITFDSKRESEVYMILKSYESKGLISNLECHPKYELIPAIKENYTVQLKTKVKVKERTVQLPITYTADFRFQKGDKEYVFDVKISKFLLPKEYTLKVKMMRYFHGIDVIEIYKPKDVDRVLFPVGGEQQNFF